MSTVESEVGAEPSLASILSNAEPAPARTEAPAAPPAAEPAKAETVAEQPRGTNGQFAPKTTPEAPPATEPPAAAQTAAATPEKQERPDFVGAIIAERRKRQAAQRAAAAQPGAQPAKTDFFENPDKAIEERLDARDSRTSEVLFNLSVKAARAGKDDYESAAQAFFEAGQKDPRLFDALRGTEDPGELIYGLGVQLRELGDPEVQGDLVRYRKKVTADAQKTIGEKDVRIKQLEDEIAGLKRQYTELSNVRGSLNTATSSRQAAVDQTDEEDLKSLTRFGKQR